MTIQPGSSPWDAKTSRAAPPGGSPNGQLQAMLARAVEDQASEQRELAGSILDVRDQLARLGHTVAERLNSIEAGLGSALTANERREMSAADRAAIETSVVAAVAPLAARLDALAEANASNSSSLAQMQARLGPIQTDLTAIGSNLQGIVDAPTPPTVNDIGATMDTTIEALEQRLRAYIEESLVALAEIVLRRRTSTVASPPVGSERADEPTQTAGMGESPITADALRGGIEFLSDPSETPRDATTSLPDATPSLRDATESLPDATESLPDATESMPVATPPTQQWAEPLPRASDTALITAEPVSLTAEPVSPTAEPVSPTAEPVSPTAEPMQPWAELTHSSPTTTFADVPVVLSSPEPADSFGSEPCISAVLSGPTQPAPDAPWKPQTPPERSRTDLATDPEQAKRRWGRRA